MLELYQGTKLNPSTIVSEYVTYMSDDLEVMVWWRTVGDMCVNFIARHTTLKCHGDSPDLSAHSPPVPQLPNVYGLQVAP